MLFEGQQLVGHQPCCKDVIQRGDATLPQHTNGLDGSSGLALLPSCAVYHIQQLPDVFRQDQVRSFFLRVNSRTKTSLLGAMGVSSRNLHASTSCTKEKERGSSSAAKPRSGLHPDMLPELRRLQEYVEHGE